MRPCDIEVTCDDCGNKQAKFKNVGKAWHTLEIEFNDERRLIIDGVDMKPAPFQPEPLKLVYFKNGKKFELENFRNLSIAVTTLCTNPECDDPMCQIWQELQRLKSERGFWRRLFRRKKNKP